MCDAAGERAALFDFLFDGVIEKMVQRLHCFECFYGFFRQPVGLQHVVRDRLKYIEIAVFQQFYVRPVCREPLRGLFQFVLLEKTVASREIGRVDNWVWNSSMLS